MTLSRTGLTRHTPLSRAPKAIRKLGDDEPLPIRQPRRYMNADGYIRLRWKVGTREYVEAYEHRVNAGRPPSHVHVHHINGDKADNRPENLQQMSADEHKRIHLFIEEYDLDRTLSSRPADPGWKREREARRLAEVERMKELYATGMDLDEVGEIVGRHATCVMRWLRAAGVQIRSLRYATSFDEQKAVDLYQSGMGIVRVARYFAVDANRITAALDAAGVPRRGPGAVKGHPKVIVSSQEREARTTVRSRSGDACERCDQHRATEWHHRKNRSQGGLWAASNGLHLCVPCHRFVTENPAAAYEAGWLVRGADDPTEWPVLYRGELSYLDDLGEVVPYGDGAA